MNTISFNAYSIPPNDPENNDQGDVYSSENSTGLSQTSPSIPISSIPAICVRGITDYFNKATNFMSSLRESYTGFLPRIPIDDIGYRNYRILEERKHKTTVAIHDKIDSNAIARVMQVEIRDAINNGVEIDEEEMVKTVLQIIRNDLMCDF